MCIRDRIYKDYKELKANIAEQRDENAALQKALATVSKETQEQRERVALCSERILVMEEQVGMMAHNEKYRQSVDGDELYQDSLAVQASKEVILNVPEGEDQVERLEYKALNPASTTSSLNEQE